MARMSQVDWKSAQVRLQKQLSADDARIVQLLAEGKSTPEIAQKLETNRSAVWRRIQKIALRLGD
jgi:DNA-binding NarL/FixJ family response regulator